MKQRFLSVVLVCLFIPALLPQDAAAQREVDDRITQLEKDVQRLKSKVRDAASTGVVFYLFGIFCALWAQNTGRSALVWFVLGLFFNIVTVLFLLTRNAEGLRKSQGV